MRTFRRSDLPRVFSTVVATAAMVGLAAEPAAASTTPPPITCTDPRTGVAFTATVVGTPGPDVLWATPGSVVAALGGDDTVFSDFAGPNAIVCLGDGADSFWPSQPGNVIQGGFGVTGGGGRDVIMGGSGADALLGGPGNDVLLGGPGSDVGNGGADVDQCDTESRISCEF